MVNPASNLHLSTAGAYKYSFSQKANDILTTISGLWLLLLFDLLAFIAFLILDQGTDVLLSIAEDVANHFRIAPLFWLLLTLFFWCIAAEFCSRLIIYLTDNSGRSLAQVRVNSRKRFQKISTIIALFFPLVIMIFAFTKAWLFNYSDFYTKSINLSFCSIIVLIGLLGGLLYKLYIGKGIVHLAKKHKRFEWLALSPRENQWVTKLYGILNDVRIDIPVSNTDFAGPDLPREKTLPNGITLPKEFVVYNGMPEKDNSLTLNIWMFKIPITFYRCLLREFITLFVIAVLFIITFAFIVPVKAYMAFGSTAMICLAFACWQVVYVMLHLVDKAQSLFPIRFFLLIMFLVTTFFNKDHPLRIIKTPNSPPRLTLTQHFNSWFDRLQTDTTRHDSSDIVYRIGGKRDTVPVVFVAAEGGALRTGAFTAMMLAKLADLYPSFPNYIYCYSGVSGGTLGTNFFNAVYMDHAFNGNKISYTAATDIFFKKDFLAAVTGKLVFGEIINYFIPFHINRLDRAIALEHAWEEGWYAINKDTNLLSSSFNQTINSKVPAIFINTTEAESGLQCIWSNTSMEGMPLNSQTDLYKRVNKNLAYSTAINLSTRFPLMSPGASIFYNQGATRRHFVDGGYYENTGAETLLKVMKSLNLESKPVKPYVIQFNFGDDDSTIKSGSIKAFSEMMEIVGGIYNTRSGRSSMARFYLQEYTTELKGEFISLHLALNTRKFPMNWILSNTAVNRLDTAIGKMVQKRIKGPMNVTDTLDLKDKNQLHKLFVY